MYRSSLSLALLVVLMLALTAPVRAASVSPNFSATGSIVAGQCLDASHLDMGVGSYVQAPTQFDPTRASDAELACYGFPPRPTDPVLLTHWQEAMSLQHPAEWVHSAPGPSLPNYSGPSAVRSAMHPMSYSGNWGVDKWGGYEADPGVVNNFNSFWLVQGEWKQQSYTHADGHTISDWVGLGCCFGPSNYLMQGGTFITDPGCTQVWCVATYAFFWEVPHWNCGPTYTLQSCKSNMTMQQINSPSLTSGQVAAFVVYEAGSADSYYEACNETSNQCSWTPPQPYAQTASPMADWITEDTSGLNPPYASVHWGPSQGPNNENIVDDIYNPNSWLVQQLPDKIHVMNINGGSTGYMAPSNIDGASNFQNCPGTYTPPSGIPAPSC